VWGGVVGEESEDLVPFMGWRRRGATGGGGRPSRNQRWCAIKRRPVTEEEAIGRGTIMGREEDEAAWLGWAARVEEGGAVAAAIASREGGGGLAFGRRKEKREWAELG
jgi:hypothetical protein